MKSIKHINSLKALEATCRLGSYAKASEELHVTPEAIGQLVRKLESHLEIKLFNRNIHKKRLIPTPAVLGLLPELTKAFNCLSNIEQQLARQSHNPKIIITAPPSLASKWLIPRLHLIQDLVQKEDIRLNITAELVDLNSTEADIAIRYGTGDWNGLITHEIFGDEKLFLVCSKSFLENSSSPLTIEGLINNTLIKDKTITDPSFPSWSDWFKKYEVDFDYKEARFLEFNMALMAIDAAVRGQGIALVREQLVKDDLKSGTLIKLFGDMEITSPWSYYIVMPQHSTVKVKQLFDWFVEHGKDL